MGRALPTYAMINLSAVQTVAAGTEVRLDLLNLADTSYQVRDRTGVGVGAPQFGIRRAILGGGGAAVLKLQHGRLAVIDGSQPAHAGPRVTIASLGLRHSTGGQS